VPNIHEPAFREHSLARISRAAISLETVGGLAFFALCTLAYFLTPVLAHRAIPLVEGDSSSYIRFLPYRDPGYPLILMAVRSLGLSLAAIPVLQIAVFSASLALLFRISAAVLRSRTYATILAGLIAFNPFVIGFQFEIMSESFFISFEILMLCAVMAFAKDAKAAHLAAASLFTGLSIIVRAAGWSFVPMLPLCVLLLLPAPFEIGRRWRGYAAALTLPLVAVIGLTIAFQHAYFGADYRSAAPRSFFSKAMLVQEGASPYAQGSLEDRLWRLADDDGGAVRAYLASIGDPLARADWSARYQAYFTSKYETDRVLPYAVQAGQAPTVPAAERAVLTVALARLERAPFSYLGVAADGYIFQWLPVNDAMDYPALESLWRTRPPPLTGPADASIFAPEKPGAFKVIMSWMECIGLGTLGLITLASIAFHARERWRKAPFDPIPALAAYAAIAVHANYVLLGFAAAPVNRYSLGMWPALAMSALFFWRVMADRMRNAELSTSLEAFTHSRTRA
jgi:hypothetical protein